MKRLNNKGFAISTMLYGLLIVIILIMTLLIGTMSLNRKNSKEFSENIVNDLEASSFAVAKIETKIGGSNQSVYKYYETLSEAINAVEQNGTIKLIKSLDVSSISVSKPDSYSETQKKFTIDLNNRELKGPFIIWKNCDVTIKNGSLANKLQSDGKMDRIIYSEGTATFDNVVMNIGNVYFEESILVLSTGKVNINNSNIITNSNKRLSTINGILNISNTPITSNITDANLIKNEGGKTSLSNVSIVNNGTTSTLIYNTSGTLNITNKTTIIDNKSMYDVIVNGGTATIDNSNGQITYNFSGGNNAIYSNGTLNVKAGSINTKSEKAIFNLGTLNMTGGSINESRIGVRNDNNGTFNMTGGSITSSDKSIYNFSGSAIVSNSTISSTNAVIDNYGGLAFLSRVLTNGKYVASSSHPVYRFVENSSTSLEYQIYGYASNDNIKCTTTADNKSGVSITTSGVWTTSGSNSYHLCSINRNSYDGVPGDYRTHIYVNDVYVTSFSQKLT